MKFTLPLTQSVLLVQCVLPDLLRWPLGRGERTRGVLWGPGLRVRIEVHSEVCRYHGGT